MNARDIEEVRLGSRCENQEVALECLAVRGICRSRRKIDRLNLGHGDIDVPVPRKYRPKIERGVVGRQRARGDLIQQWLELLVVVLIKYDDLQVFVACQLSCTVQPGKAATYDYDFLLAVDIFHIPPSSLPLKQVVHGEGHGIVRLDVYTGRQCRSHMPRANVEAPSRIGVPRQPDCVDQIARSTRDGYILEAIRLLIDFKGWRDDYPVLDREREGDRAKPA